MRDAMSSRSSHEALDAWVDSHFDEQLRFLQELVRVPTDTPPGNNAPHARRTAALLKEMGFDAEQYDVADHEVQAGGLQSITNLVVRRKYGPGLIVGLNAHGDVVPPGAGWSRDPYAGEVADGKLYGRAAAVSKSDMATYTFAVRALEALQVPLKGGVELIFTYDEEFGGELGVGWLLHHGLSAPDYVLAAGFSYQVVTAHNGCLQLAVTVHGKSAHAAIPHSGVDALQGASTILLALYQRNQHYRSICSKIEGISHPYVNVGWIEGGTNTNVVPGKVEFKLDRRLIPEEDLETVEVEMRTLIADVVAALPGISVEVRPLLRAQPWRPDPRSAPLVRALQHHGKLVFGEAIPAIGTPLYTDVRLFSAAGIPCAIYGAGPRTVAESNAKRGDEHLVLEDLRGATKVVARTLLDLLG